jgi:hypothetical protein
MLAFVFQGLQSENARTLWSLAWNLLDWEISDASFEESAAEISPDEALKVLGTRAASLELFAAIHGCPAGPLSTWAAERGGPAFRTVLGLMEDRDVQARAKYIHAVAKHHGHAGIATALVARLQGPGNNPFAGTWGDDLLERVAATAAGEGVLDVVQWAFRSWTRSEGFRTFSEQVSHGAAIQGTRGLDVLRWMHRAGHPILDAVPAELALTGSLEGVQWALLEAELPPGSFLGPLALKAHHHAARKSLRVLNWLLHSGYDLQGYTQGTRVWDEETHGDDIALRLLSETFPFVPPVPPRGSAPVPHSLAELAAFLGDLDVVQWCAERLPPPPSWDAAIRAAAENGHADVRRWLLSRGAAVEGPDASVPAVRPWWMGRGEPRALSPYVV